MNKISTKTIQELKASDLLTVAQHFYPDMKKSGKSHLHDCNVCAGTKGVHITPSKNIFKCFKCGDGGKGPIKYLQQQHEKNFPEACQITSELNAIPLADAPTALNKDTDSNADRSMPFAHLQLKSSGLFPEKLKDRYLSGTLDRQYNYQKTGDDMVLVYKDLEGEIMTYTPKGKVKKRQLFRVRYKHPELHKDKNGKPVKYRSPYGSGSALWIPDQIIDKYQQKQPIETLFLTEGEKKADKLCFHGLPSVGIMGIQNFAYDKQMPRQFEQIISTCQVKKVVFLLDSDWDDISDNPDRPVHLRPWSFFTAVAKYRHYFYAFNASGIHLDIFFGYHKDTSHKGIDDLLHRKYYKNPDDAIHTIEQAIESRKLKKKEFEFHRITEKNEWQLKKYWHLDNAQAFFDQHKKKLKEFETFRYFKILYRWNGSEFEMAQKLLPAEEFWEQEVNDLGQLVVTGFNYTASRYFFRNRNIGLFERTIHNRILIHIDQKQVHEIDHIWVQNYVLDFVEQLNRKDVMEKMLKGMNHYLGPTRMNNLYHITPQFIEDDPEKQYMVFKDKFWEITANGVTEHAISSLPGDIWAREVIDFEPELISPESFLEIERDGDQWDIDLCNQLEEFSWFGFLKATSDFAWRRHQEEVTDKDGNTTYISRNDTEYQLHELRELVNNLIPKIIATGFILHDYNNLSDMRAVVCVDGTETEVGKSEGGTGKSLFTKQFSHSRDCLGINGKKRDLETDPFIYDAAKQSTRVIYFDDCRIGMDFEHFFSQITKPELEINVKNGRKFNIKTPRFIFNTNHAFRRDSYSFKRRQYIISFSDYFNEYRRPVDQFQKQFFVDWDHHDWNIYYNFLAHCIKTYLKFGLKYEAPEEDVLRRNMRQRMGENFLDWAMDFFNPEGDYSDSRINKKVEKRQAYRAFIDDFPGEKRYTSLRIFKQKLQDFANYIDHEYWLPPGKKRIKQGNHEYIVIANDELNAENIPIAGEMMEQEIDFV